MNSLKTLCFGISMGLASQMALANKPVDVRLDFAANNLTFASQQLVDSLRACRGDNHVVDDALTLNFAASHFKEEVELGPEDLAVDFNTINQTFLEIRSELMNSNEIRFNANARAAYFNVEESYLNLRLAFTNQAGMGGGENRPGDDRRPGGGNRPGDDRRPGGGYRPGDDRRPGGGYRPGDDRRPGGGYRPGDGNRFGGPRPRIDS